MTIHEGVIDTIAMMVGQKRAEGSGRGGCATVCAHAATPQWDVNPANPTADDLVGIVFQAFREGDGGAGAADQAGANGWDVADLAILHGGVRRSIRSPPHGAISGVNHANTRLHGRIDVGIDRGGAVDGCRAGINTIPGHGIAAANAVDTAGNRNRGLILRAGEGFGGDVRYGLPTDVGTRGSIDITTHVFEEQLIPSVVTVGILRAQVEAGVGHFLGVIRGVHVHGQAHLLEVVQALGGHGFAFCVSQGGQEHAGQNGDDRDDDKQLDQGESPDLGQ